MAAVQNTAPAEALPFIITVDPNVPVIRLAEALASAGLTLRNDAPRAANSRAATRIVARSGGWCSSARSSAPATMVCQYAVIAYYPGRCTCMTV